MWLWPPPLSKYLIVLYSPFHSKKALSRSSLAYLGCQHPDSSISGPLVSRIRVPRTQGSRPHNQDGPWLTGGQRLLRRWIKDDLVPGRRKWSTARFHLATQNRTRFKAYELFVSEIFHLIFSDLGWQQVTETPESKTTDKENYRLGPRSQNGLRGTPDTPVRPSPMDKCAPIRPCWGRLSQGQDERGQSKMYGKQGWLLF